MALLATVAPANGLAQAPTITSRSVPIAGTYAIGQSLDVTVTFSSAVTVTGVPSVPITIGSTIYQANYVSGSTTATLVFRYTLVGGESDSDGVAIGAIELNGGTIKDGALDATITGTFGATPTVLVDAVRPTATITRLGANPTGQPISGSVSYLITFSEAVSGFDITDLAVSYSGGVLHTGEGLGAGASNTYTATLFNVIGTGTISLGLTNLGGITDSAGNVMTASPTLSTYTVDNTSPTVTSVTLPASATYVTGNVLTFTVNFDEAISLNLAGGTPSLSRTIGSTIRAAQLSVLGASSLSFAYTLTSGEVDLGGIDVNSLDLNGATIKDGVGNNAVLALTGVVNPTGVLVDATPPTVASTSVPISTTHIAGQNMDFTITFSETVTVGGAPTVNFTLNTGGAVSAAYVSGSGSTTLLFRRVVQVGDADPDGITITGVGVSGANTIRDAAGNDAIVAGINFGSTSAVLVDGVAPTVASINPATAGPTNATSVTFTATFSEGVTGVTADDFQLTATGTAAGTIASVSATSTSVYSVTVNTVSGNGTLRLDLNNVGTGIADLPGNAIAAGFSGGNTLTVDNTAPVVASVAVPANATYVAAQTLSFTVNFSENVTVNTAGGTPTLNMTLGLSAKTAAYTGGSGTSALTFAYTITAGDLDTDGIVIDALALNGGTISDSATNNATLTLNAVGSTVAVLVDTVAPSVAGTTVPANNTYISGQNLDFTVTYFETVNVTGTPSVALTLNTGGTVQANYVNGTGTTTLTFRRAVAAGNVDSDGIAVAGSISLNGGTIKDAAGNDAATAVTFGATTGVLVDGVAPTVASINPSTAGPTNATSATFTATFSEGVTGVTADDFSLTTTGGAAGTIASVSATSTSVYSVTVNTVSGNGTLRLDLNNAGTGIADTAGNPITAGFTSGNTIAIDSVAPTVASVAVPANATYIAGQTLTFTVNFSESVTVNTTGGTPSLGLTIGSSAKSAAYTGGTGTTALTFAYTIVSADLDSDGIAVGALALNGGTITDSATNNATLTLNAVGATTGVLVDADAPTVASSTIPASNTYIVGQNLDFTVTFSENVTVTGTPSVAVTLDTGGTVQANYISGSGTPTLTFRHTVAASNLDTNGITVAASISLNGGTIKDQAGNNAATGVTFAATTNVKVDGVAPSVASIVRAGASPTKASSLVYTVTFSEPVANVDAADFFVTVSGGATGSVASVTATSTSVYSVTVTASSSGTLRLDLNNATNITDTAGNAISGGYQSGEIYTRDSTEPTLISIYRHLPNTVNTAATSVTWRAAFSEDVTGVDASDFVLVRNGPNNSNTVPAATIASVTASTGSVYEIVVNAISGVGTVQLNLKESNTGIVDLTNNDLAVGYSEGEYYAVGAASVLDTVLLASSGNQSVTIAQTLSQRFTTGASPQLTLRSVSAQIGQVTGSANARLKLYRDNNGAVGAYVTQSDVLTVVANSLNTWNLSLTPLLANTAYWLVFTTETQGGSYNVSYSSATTGGLGAWLTNADYTYISGSNPAAAGVVRLAFGAGSIPVINSSLIASGTYRSAISPYTITATGGATSYAATNLPPGLTLNSQSGVISGTPTAAGSYTVSITATNENGASSPASLAFTINRVALTVTAEDKSRAYGVANPALTVTYSGFVGGDTAASLTTAPTATTSATTNSIPATYAIVPAGGVSSNYTFSYVQGTLTVLASSPGGGGGGGGGGIIVTTPTKTTATVTLGSLTQTYNGSARAATATTSPAGLTVRLTYNGSTSAPVDAGTYAVVASIDNTSYQGTASGTLTVGKASQTVTFPAVSLGAVGSTVTLGATASSGLPVAYSVVSGTATLSGSSLRFNDGASVTVRASQAGNTNYNAVSTDQVIGGSSKLDQAITFAALTDREATSGAFTLTASASSGLVVTFSVASGPATVSGSTVTLTGDSGVVTITASQAGNSTYNAAADVSRSFTVTGGKVLARLVNLSILTSLDAAGDTFTLGYVLGGRGTSGSKNVLVRAVGPTLGGAPFNVPGVLSDPKIELYAGRVLSTENNNWGGAAALSAVFSSVGAFPLAPATSLDAAALATVTLGDNSVVVSGNGNVRGTVLAELYDTTPFADLTASSPRFVNVSVLKNLGTGLTIGFVIDGTGSKRVLIRAVGPTLGAAPFNVGGVVADPQLALYSGQTSIRTNDNWGGTTELVSAFAQVGAFALPGTSRDAAIAVTLEPGAYTVQVSGVGSSTGIALVEVYEIPE